MRSRARFGRSALLQSAILEVHNAARSMEFGLCTAGHNEKAAVNGQHKRLRSPFHSFQNQAVFAFLN
jgi:hypothetical protein